MKQLIPNDSQEYLSFSNEDIIIIDKIQNMPENTAYYSQYVLLLICTEGKLQTNYDGIFYTIHKGEIFLCVPGSVLSDYMLSPNFDGKILAIMPTETASSRVLHSQLINTSMYIKSNPVAKLTEDEYASVFDYYNLICNRIQNSGDRYHSGEVRALLNAFLLHVVGIMDRGMETPNEKKTVRGEQLVGKFVRMVNDDAGRNRFVEYYAEQLNITPKYLSMLVKNALGRTPTDVIKAVTMKEIEYRLRYSDESIKEISNALNFPNTSFFGKYFKHYSGITPNTYRKKYH